MHEATRRPSIWLQRASAGPDHVSVSHSAIQPLQPAGPQDRRTLAPRPVVSFLLLPPADRLCICKAVCSRLLTGRGLEGLGLEPEFEPSRPQAPAGDLHRAAQGICWLPGRESQATSQGSCSTTWSFLPPWPCLAAGRTEDSARIPGRCWNGDLTIASSTRPSPSWLPEHDKLCQIFAWGARL